MAKTAPESDHVRMAKPIHSTISPKIIRRSHVTKHPSLGQIMPRVTGTPQMTNNMVRLYIREHPGKEQYRPDNKLRGTSTTPGIKIRRGKIKIHPPCIHAFNTLNVIPINMIPIGILPLPFSNNGKNKRTLKIMYLEKNKEDQRHQLIPPIREIPEKVPSL